MHPRGSVHAPSPSPAHARAPQTRVVADRVADERRPAREPARAVGAGAAGGVEPHAVDDHERVARVREDRQVAPGPGRAPVLELARGLGRADQPGRGERVADRARAVVGAGDERAVAAAVDVGEVGDRVAAGDHLGDPRGTTLRGVNAPVAGSTRLAAEWLAAGARACAPRASCCSTCARLGAPGLAAAAAATRGAAARACGRGAGGVGEALRGQRVGRLGDERGRGRAQARARGARGASVAGASRRERGRARGGRAAAARRARARRAARGAAAPSAAAIHTG